MGTLHLLLEQPVKGAVAPPRRPLALRYGATHRHQSTTVSAAVGPVAEWSAGPAGGSGLRPLRASTV